MKSLNLTVEALLLIQVTSHLQMVEVSITRILLMIQLRRETHTKRLKIMLLYVFNTYSKTTIKLFSTIGTLSSLLSL
jgi:hypothetical protein